VVLVMIGSGTMTGVGSPARLAAQADRRCSRPLTGVAALLAPVPAEVPRGPARGPAAVRCRTGSPRAPLHVSMGAVASRGS